MLPNRPLPGARRWYRLVPLVVAAVVGAGAMWPTGPTASAMPVVDDAADAVAPAGSSPAAFPPDSPRGGDGHGVHHHPGAAVPDERRGITLAGLRRDPAACASGLAVGVSVAGRPLCTHGPDPAPPAVDVRTRRDPDTTAGGEGSSTGTEASGVTSCTGDGTSGRRVQAVYAVAADREDRYDSTVGSIREWAAQVEHIFDASARETGGARGVRWVTSSCSLTVAHVVVPADADDSLTKTIEALRRVGFDRSDRKYLIWADANVYCGIAAMFGDDSPDSDNLNNGGYALYARVDNGCWGRTGSVEAHELAHTMGGVQASAPHATPSYHCTDEHDVMCYQDSPSTSLSYVCPSSQANRLDCNHDDYFHTAPPSGSYLATHWNVAASAFLHQPESSPPPASPPPPSTTPPPPQPSPDPTPPPAPTTRTDRYAGITLTPLFPAHYDVDTAAGPLRAVVIHRSLTPVTVRVLDANRREVGRAVSGTGRLEWSRVVAGGRYTVVVDGTAAEKYTVEITYVAP